MGLSKEKNQNGTSNNEELDKLAAEAEGGGGSTDAPGPTFTMNAGLLKSFWKTLFGVIARNAGPHWNLQDDEAAQLGELSVPVAEKWLPAFMGKYGAEMMLAGCVVMIVVDRMEKSKGHEEKSGSVGNPRAEGFGQVYSA